MELFKMNFVTHEILKSTTFMPHIWSSKILPWSSHDGKGIDLWKLIAGPSNYTVIPPETLDMNVQQKNMNFKLE